MKLKLMIVDLEVPPKVKRVALRLGVAGLVVGGGAGVAWAAMPHTFSAGEKLKAAELNENFAAMETRLAKLEADRDSLQARLDAVADPDSPCPAGYESAGLAETFLPNSVLCRKGRDEVVKVGAGRSTFWVDRYEASAWTTPDAQNGTQLEDADETSFSAAGLPKNGQGRGVFALSVRNVMPSRNLTWFQALEACAATGKALPTGPEWVRAARGTEDPTNGNDGLAGGNNRCNTQSAGPRPTNKALGNAQVASCVSDWGAEEMIGNLWEWTSDWYASTLSGATHMNQRWPGEYGGDSTLGISSWAVTSATSGGSTWQQGLPAGAQRGGSWENGTLAGVFDLHLQNSPSVAHSSTGFRCVLPR